MITRKTVSSKLGKGVAFELDGSRILNVYGTRGYRGDNWVEIEWSTIGKVDIETAEMFHAALGEAIAAAKEMQKGLEENK